VDQDGIDTRRCGNGAVRDRRAIPPRAEPRGFPRNWMNITLILWSIVSFVLTFVLIGVIGYVILSIYFLVTVILAAVANSKGEIYRYPFILRLIK
jgi:hypothetical protein